MDDAGGAKPFRGSLQEIRLFVAAYEERSFTAAAAREDSTQSGVSSHIRQLEDILGVKLFVREKAGVVATPAGDLYYRHCVELLRSLDAATNRVSRLANDFHGSFAIGLIPSLTHRIGAPMLLKFAEAYPNVKLRIVELYSSTTSDMVAAGEIDCAISGFRGGSAGLQGRLLFSAPECIVSRVNEKGEAPPSEVSKLAGSTFDMVWASRLSDRRSTITQSLLANGIRIDRELEVDSGLVTLDLVSRSNWKTVMPAYMVDPEADTDRFHIVPLRNPGVSFAIYLLERSRTVMPPELQAFVDMVVAEAARRTEFWVDAFAKRSA